MNKENLVLCQKSFETETDTFKRGKFYRCLPQGEGDNIQLLVHGVVFDLVNFADKFQFAHNVIIEEWTKMGLILDNKPITKKEFKERLDCHKFGSYKNGFFCGFISHEHPKNLSFQFNSNYRETKAQFIKNTYDMYVDVINGDVQPFDNKLICRGNSGIPIGRFAEIYWKWG